MDPCDDAFHDADKGINGPEISGERYKHGFYVEVRMNLTKKMHRVNPKPVRYFRRTLPLFPAPAGMDITADVIAGKILAGGIR
jgi:hypothetical protein